MDNGRGLTRLPWQPRAELSYWVSRYVYENHRMYSRKGNKQPEDFKLKQDPLGATGYDAITFAILLKVADSHRQQYYCFSSLSPGRASPPSFIQ